MGSGGRFVGVAVPVVRGHLMSRPDWEWIDRFGDKLAVHRAGADLVIRVDMKDAEPGSAAVSLSPEQQRGLRAAIAAHRELTARGQ